MTEEDIHKTPTIRRLIKEAFHELDFVFSYIDDVLIESKEYL